MPKKRINLLIKNKKGFEFSFGWLFAILIGAAIIFLAIYFASSIVTQERKSEDSSVAKQFDIILYPASTGLEENKIAPISFPVTTRISLKCLQDRDFGKQIIKTSSSSTIGQQYQNNGINVESSDKYIFSQQVIEGKEFFAFAKPLSLPFKIADLIYMIPKDERYCFVFSPDRVKEELQALMAQDKNFNSSIYFTESYDVCPKISKKICFNIRDKRCNAQIIEDKIIINNEEVYYDEGMLGNALLYGAVFSEPVTYECQLKRLMKRVSELSMLYADKGQSLSASRCTSGIEQDLRIYSNATRLFNSSSTDLDSIIKISNDIGGKNSELSCPLF